jgi:nucleotide-binding universal stress UspA family protein
MYKYILVPLDGSALAEQILPFAIQLARSDNATIYLTQVNDLFNEAETCQVRCNEHLTKIVQRHLALDEAYLIKLARKLRAQQIDVRTIVCTGAIVPTLLEISEIYHCDLLLLSRHGTDNDHRHQLGSVTQDLLEASKVPVIVYTREEMAHANKYTMLRELVNA